MKPARFDYQRAESVDEAISLLADDARESRVIAGGQTLGPLLNLRLVHADRLVDISRIGALAQCHEEAEAVTLGAGTTHAAIEDRRVPDPSNGLMTHVAAGIAYRSVRNRGTLGGSLAYADPAAEWPAVMMALGAGVVLQGPRGRREASVQDFVEGPMSVDLAEHELLVAIRVARHPDLRWGFRKLCRKAGEFAHSLAVVVLGEQSRAVIGATAAGAIDMPRCAQRLAAETAWNATVQSALHEAYAADIEASAVELDEYDRHVHWHCLTCAAREGLGS